MLPMNLKHRTLRVYGRLMVAAVPLLLPALAMARPSEEDTAVLEGRLEGYPSAVRLAEPGSTGLTWMLLIFLAVISLSVLFKDAKRTHLD